MKAQTEVKAIRSLACSPLTLNSKDDGKQSAKVNTFLYLLWRLKRDFPEKNFKEDSILKKIELLLYKSAEGENPEK